MYSNFGIDLYSRLQQYWDSTDWYDLHALLDEAIAEHGTAGYDIMVAYTGQSTSYGGMAYLGSAYCIVMYQGYDNDWKETQHEVSHLYYALDHYYQGVCVMSNPYSYPDIWCTSGYNCWHTVYNNRYLH